MEYERRITQRLAFLLRYGHVPLSEALHTDSRWLDLLCHELAELIRGENKPVSR